MFHSATLKLTAWYLGIIMVISILFSFAIYQINFHEVNLRLENLQNGLLSITGNLSKTNSAILQTQSDQAALQMVLSLVYINAVILVTGGALSYILARRTLKPIEQAHEAQSRFTSDASHELRTPLATMKTEIEVILRDKKLDLVEARELLESNLEEVEKLTQLSEMLLNLSRLDYDHLEKKRLVLASVVNETLKTLKVDHKRLDLTVRKDTAVLGNRAAVRELITVLIDNALKYSEPDSKITIRTFQKVRMAGFEISNTGPTIHPNALPHLFDRFFRADYSRTNSTKNGYGLGLAIAKKITDVHDGTIEVESKNGRTTFTFCLPLYRQNPLVSSKKA